MKYKIKINSLVKGVRKDIMVILLIVSLYIFVDYKKEEIIVEFPCGKVDKVRTFGTS